jgi:chromosome segregation ATPase
MYENATALEICAGGKLYNVVVEDEKIGSALLNKGKLRKRVTIIPLNKINAFEMTAEVSAADLSLALADFQSLSYRNWRTQKGLLLARPILRYR